MRLFVRKSSTIPTQTSEEVKTLNMPFLPCRLESCVRVWDEAPAASSPPAGPSPVCSGEVAGQPRSVTPAAWRLSERHLCFLLLCCSIGGFGILQLFRDQNQVWGLLLKLYQIFASKNPELAAVYQPSLRLLSSSRVFSVAERIMTDLHRTAVNTERFPCSVLRRKREKKPQTKQKCPVTSTSSTPAAFGRPTVSEHN